MNLSYYDVIDHFDNKNQNYVSNSDFWRQFWKFSNYTSYSIPLAFIRSTEFLIIEDQLFQHTKNEDEHMLISPLSDYLSFCPLNITNDLLKNIDGSSVKVSIDCAKSPCAWDSKYHHLINATRSDILTVQNTSIDNALNADFISNLSSNQRRSLTRSFKSVDNIIDSENWILSVESTFSRDDFLDIVNMVWHKRGNEYDWSSSLTQLIAGISMVVSNTGIAYTLRDKATRALKAIVYFSYYTCPVSKKNQLIYQGIASKHIDGIGQFMLLSFYRYVTNSKMNIDSIDFVQKNSMFFNPEEHKYAQYKRVFENEEGFNYSFLYSPEPIKGKSDVMVKGFTQ